MIVDVGPYPAYKPSHVPGLGDVPVHWDVRRLKHICRLAYGDSLAVDAREEGSVPVYGSNGRVGSHSRANTEAPCIIVGRKGSFGKIRISSVPVFAIDTTFYIDGRQTTEDLRWLYYLLGCLRLDAVTKDSAIPGLDREDVYRRLAAIPPIAEQMAIARFLDHVDRRIRRYVRAKQKLIRLLEEQKQVVIHQAVTRGLDPRARLKPSGVEWLGDVPDHWRLMPLKYLSRGVQIGTTPPTSMPAFYEGGTIPWYGPSSCGDGELVRTPVRYLASQALREGRAKLIQPPALLIVMIGATAGRMALLDSAGATNQQIIAFELLGSEVIPRFVVSQTRSAERWLRATASTATIPIIDSEVMKRLSVALPPIQEQRAIVEHIAKKTATYDSMLVGMRREIRILLEYRTRLISDVVTGKLDVREAAANLPDEPEQPEPLDDVEESAETEPEEVKTDELDAVLEEVEA